MPSLAITLVLSTLMSRLCLQLTWLGDPPTCVVSRLEVINAAELGFRFLCLFCIVVYFPLFCYGCMFTFVAFDLVFLY